jgi:hypothetical protein
MKPPLNLSLILGGLWLASVVAAFYAGGSFRSEEATKATASGNSSGNNRNADPSFVPGSSPDRRLEPSPLARKSVETPASRNADDKLSIGERFKAIMESDDAVVKMSGFLALLAELGDSTEFADVAAVLMTDFNPRENGREFSMLMQKWGESDPMGALEYAKGIDDWPGRWAASTVLSKFVATNRDEAIAWAKENGMPEKGREEDGNWMMSGVISGLAKIDPDAASELARNEPRSRARGDMMEALLGAYLERGEDAARTWATNLPDDVFKVGALSRLAGRLADKDLESTVKWVESLPTGEATPRVFSEVVERWARDNPNEAGNWLGTFPASPEMDEPRQTFAWRIRERDPESAIAWAATISNPEQREKATYELARDWVRREPEAAKTWVATSPLPDDVKKRLIGG